MKNKRGLFVRLLSILMVLVGVGVLMYPTFADYMSTRAQQKAVGEYDAVKNKADTSKIDEEMKLAHNYNDNLVGKPVHDPFSKDQGYVLSSDYTERLNIAGNGVMGTIKIPSIKVDLPIYHGVSEESLRKGVGHIEGTSLPVGGESSHCILSGHRGLPEATLFTYLNEVKKGDEFYLHILNDVFAYKVYDIEVVKPDKLNSTRPVDGKDLVTLVTCTPYGVNTERLLVHGERVPYHPKDEKKDDAVKAVISHINYRYMACGIAIGLVIVYILIKVIKAFRKKRA